MTPEADEKKPLTYHLYHDGFFIGRVVEEVADFPSIHCTVDVREMDNAPEWREPLERYMEVSVEHHRLMLDGKSGEALALESAMIEAAEPFGDHLWYLVKIDSEVSTKINRPYFGTEKYLRFSYAPSRVEFDGPRLEAGLKNRLTFMIFSLSDECESMEKAHVKQHLETLFKLSALSLKTSAEGVDLDRVVEEWFGELNQLDTEIAMFKRPGDRRRLEQAAAYRS
jgi:hypothetical protein